MKEESDEKSERRTRERNVKDERRKGRKWGGSNKLR